MSFDKRFSGPRVRINALTQAKILRMLYTGPCGWRDIMAKTGAGEWAVRSYIGHLRREKLVRVGDWGLSPKGARTRELYEWAPDERDEPKPKPKTVAQRSRDARARRRQRAVTQAVTGRTPEAP